MRRITDKVEQFIGAVEMWGRSPIHRDWPIDDYLRLTMPALRADQIVVLADTDDRVVGLATWAWLSPAAAAGYLNGTRKLQPGDWTRRLDSDQPYVIDVIAPDCARAVIREVKTALTRQGAEQASWRRSAKGRFQTYTKRDYS